MSKSINELNEMIINSMFGINKSRDFESNHQNQEIHFKINEELVSRIKEHRQLFGSTSDEIIKNQVIHKTRMFTKTIQSFM